MNELGDGYGEVVPLPKPPKAEPKYFSANEAVKMLPLIVGYCRDIESIYAELAKYVQMKDYLEKLTSLSEPMRQKQQQALCDIECKIDMGLDTLRRYREELLKMNMKICSMQLGRVDVPVFDLNTNSALYLCIHKNSTPQDLEWHCLPDNHTACRPYWFRVQSHPNRPNLTR